MVFLPGPLIYPALLYTRTPEAKALPESGLDRLNRADCQAFNNVGRLGRKIHEEYLPRELPLSKRTEYSILQGNNPEKIQKFLPRASWKKTHEGRRAS